MGFKVPKTLAFNTEEYISSKDTGEGHTVNNVSPIDITPLAVPEQQTVQTDTGSDFPGNQNNVNMNVMMTAFTIMSKCMMDLQSNVNNLMKEKLYDVNKPYSLEHWYKTQTNVMSEPCHAQDDNAIGFNRAGVRSHDFPIST